MKKIILLGALLLTLALSVNAAEKSIEQNLTKKIQMILPEGWTVTASTDGIKMYERAAQSLEIKDFKHVAGFLLTVADTKIIVPKDSFHPQDYNPYFEIYFYKLALTEEQIIKYNRLVNAMYNRPAGTQEEFPPRFVYQNGEYIIMKSPAWGKSQSPKIDTLMLKIMTMIRKELPPQK